ncbi:tectonin domain-containing protein, partial [Salmonella sp. s55004]|uniref:tectonin domain-containing protein n=1 Tax=Salmonella sp. s55004 TaxID=3159675 RepID=UPI00397EF7E2
MQIDGGHAFIYGVNSNKDVYTRPVDGSGSWRHIPGAKLKYVNADGKDDIFGVSETGTLMRCKKPCIGEWVEDDIGMSLNN